MSSPLSAEPTLIYLDNNASTRLCDEAFMAMLPWLRDHWANPSSLHSEGRAAAAAVDDARRRLAHALQVTAGQIVFTSGASESTALAILGARRAKRPPRRLLTARSEHRSVLSACQKAVDAGMGVRFLTPDAAGRVTAASFAEESLGPDDLVTVMWVNNETGVINDIAAIAETAHARGALLHVDAAQALGKVEVDLGSLGADYVTLSAHKAHGPKGVGALVLGPGAELAALWTGGAQEGRRRGGTEDVPGVVGFAVAVEAIMAAGAAARDRMERLRDALAAALLAGPEPAVVIGAEAPRAPNTLMISWPGLDGGELLRRLDEVGVAASSASACSRAAGSHVLTAIGESPAVVRGAVRFSLSRETTEAEIDRAIALIIRAVTDMRR